ncbi:hypothetical protein [Thorsellia kenyensis]|uniref:Uncharacterized protein n=1 Tax=Thorsellia kenyensis TaxID=1549888 RepID=A0ABV6C9Y1_9GAMM
MTIEGSTLDADKNINLDAARDILLLANFGIGVGTTAEADRLGKIWVGDGAKLVGDQKGCPGCLVSADGLRIYRPPTYKPNPPKNLNPTGVQANFVQLEKGKVVSNGHMGIEK